MEILKVKITGMSPLIVHSDRTVNVFDPDVKKHKALAGKKVKTEEEQLAVALSEWRLSLYFDPTAGPYLPSRNLEAAILDAARLQRLGKKFLGAVTIQEEMLPLEYDGPRTLAELEKLDAFRDVRGVRVQKARILRCRPVFREWAVSATLQFDPATVKKVDLLKTLEATGSQIGVGDHRPRHGRFTVTEV
jgi:hypothetical protein